MQKAPSFVCFKFTTFAISFFLVFSCFVSNAQEKKDAKKDTLAVYFKNKQKRIESTSDKQLTYLLEVFVPIDQRAKKSKVEITVNNDKSTVDKASLFFNDSKSFNTGELEDTIVKIPVIFNRDDKDDKRLVFLLKAKDSSNNDLPLRKGETTLDIIIKPVSDSLSGLENKGWEFWLFSGTNFDVFDGVKAQEFFFRGNMIFKVNKKFHIQFGVYKNRFFTTTDTTNKNSFVEQVPVIPPRDSFITIARGVYEKTVTETNDPLGFHIDAMLKIGGWEDKLNNDKSSFFATTGFDLSSRKVTFKNNIFNIVADTTAIKVRPDSLIRFNPLVPKTISYQKPSYNFGVGLMWILDNREINIKAHIQSGLNIYWEPRYTVISRNLTVYDVLTDPYVQLRMFATHKKGGISLGFEYFQRSHALPLFNFTLSKVIDIRQLGKVFEPVSSLFDSKN